jgi:hypothetical protein
MGLALSIAPTPTSKPGCATLLAPWRRRRNMHVHVRACACPRSRKRGRSDSGCGGAASVHVPSGLRRSATAGTARAVWRPEAPAVVDGVIAARNRRCGNCGSTPSSAPANLEKKIDRTPSVIVEPAGCLYHHHDGWDRLGFPSRVVSHHIIPTPVRLTRAGREWLGLIRNCSAVWTDHGKTR